MMKPILKWLFISVLLYLIMPFSSAYNSDDLKTFYTDSPDTWTSLFIVPEWKDLILNRVNSSDINETIQLRNSTWSILATISGKTEYLGWELVIKDDLQIISTPWTNVDIMLFGYLVSEDEDITNYIQGNSNAWNKHIFNKSDIEFIYRWEFVLFFFLTAIKFMSVIIWRPLNIF